MMNKEDMAYLIQGYMQNTLSDAERQTFINEALTEENRELYQEVAASLLEDSPDLAPFDEKLWPLFHQVLIADKPSLQIASKTNPAARRLPSIRKWGWAAAVVLLAASSFLLLKRFANDGTQNRSPSAIAQDFPPGRNGAVLTLANGRNIVLDSLENGMVAHQSGADVVLKNGELAYDKTAATPDEPEFNTMTTPKGRQYQLTLPDGTKVWLNSASSIRFPTAFIGKERRVDIHGEAYFEVAKNAGMPFRVRVGDDMEIEVLGTHFNVNAYENENTYRTTLLEGRVKVTAFPDNSYRGAASGVIAPGQQAAMSRNAGITVLNNADINKTMAWKNGLFNFEGATLEEVMKQLERWYDIEVIYENGIPDIAFDGKMTKDIPLAGLLVMLEKSKVHFRLEGRKLVVLP
ncbi:FecR family protein [Chitinophaga rhizosphaerae]|uniref:FecR family protein n=1 Tax=Chitinophaga rhizosphaerae TaxID=1864947 RepID=UPI000F806493|nr:FecR family protein [Chitinophaga rhizosphaerae]